jgi:[acyl-carrier-protein] S-malonyltransferase
MGKDLYDSSAAVRDLYAFASDAIGEDIARISFEGPAEELKRTRFTQPAIMLHSLAVLTVMGDNVPAFDFACGHSLGEYAALAVTGAMTFEDAVRAVVKRADLMEQACVANPGTMAALVAMPPDKIDALCEKASAKGIVIPANFNSKMQVAISGSYAAVEEAVRLAPEAGAKKAIMLEVGGAFHSPLMEPAKKGLADFLEGVTISAPSRPVIANVTAQPVTDPAEIRRLLIQQVTAPVKWSQTMAYLGEHDVKAVYEIGPGKVLASLAKRELRPDTLRNLDKLEDIKAFSEVTV